MSRAAWLLPLACLALSRPASALPLNPTTVVNATNEIFKDIIAFVGLGLDLHPYEYAKPFSTTLGVDAGVSVTAIQLPGLAVNALTSLGVPNVPHYLPVPKINIQKGLFDKFTLGTEFIPSISIQGNRIGIIGADLQWNAIDRPRLPPISLRAQYNYANLIFVRTQTLGFDALVGYPVLFANLYGGLGYRYVMGWIDNPTGTLPILRDINFSPNVDAGHFFAGCAFRAGFFRLTLEADLTTQAVNTYGAKLSLFF